MLSGKRSSIERKMIIKTGLQAALTLCVVFCLSVVNADEGHVEDDVILLWPTDRVSHDSPELGTLKPDRGDGHIRVTNINVPSLQYFPAPTQADPVPLVVLCPGGGYSYLVVTKMQLIAEWLNENGIAACILKYRTPMRREDAFKDVQRAIRVVRSRALEWGVNLNQIGVMGASAGGHLAARASTAFKVASYQAVDEIDSISCRPNFTALLYPAYMNTGDELNPEFSISDEISPTLIISARNDVEYFPGSVVYAKALEAAGVPNRVHFFDEGGHGFTLRPDYEPLAAWPDLYLKWLKDIEVLGVEPK